PPFQRPDEFAVVRYRAPVHTPERLHLTAPGRLRDLEAGVGAERRDYASSPAGLADPAVVREVVRGGVGSGQDFDPEPLEKRSRPVFWRFQPLDDVVVDGVG